MRIDAELAFSNSQALTATAASTNIVDLGPAHKLDGEPMAVMFVIEVAADFTSTNETYSYALETDDNAGFSSATVLATKAILASAQAIRTRHYIEVPVGAAVERYLRINHTLAGTTPSVTLSSYLMPVNMIQKDAVYAKGYTIS